MGTIIEAVAYVAGGRLHARSGRKLADAAIRKAIARAGLDVRDIGLLVNAGLYHDGNLGEPALAALIQEDVGANPEDPYAGGHGTFSFDVANGTCGALNGLQIADGFLRAGTIRHAVVVAGDADPGHSLAPGFPFEPAAAAVVCGWDDSSTGFGGFRWLTAQEDAALRQATVAYEGGHNVLRIEERPEFAGVAAVWAAKVVAELLADAGLTAGALDLVVAAPSTSAFTGPFAAHSCIPPDRVVVAGSPRLHTAALLAALDAAPLASGQRVLLVCAGAGVTVGAALFTP